MKFLLPGSFYRHPSFRFDMLWLPFSVVLNFFGLLGVTLGPGIVQNWLQQRFGHSPIQFPDGALALALQGAHSFCWHATSAASCGITRDMSSRSSGSSTKGHHSAEILHPFGVRTHPVDMFIRNTYTGVGSGLIAGTLIYALGMNYTVVTASYVTLALAIFLAGEIFEHTHVRVSFGKTLNRIFYAPYMHHFHHGARPEHMNVNLGITGGLTLWDYLSDLAAQGRGPRAGGLRSQHRKLKVAHKS